ncbi:penicillin-binding transpeptidase domain-containing protein [uncultured Tissierella sp.]|uniref:peptidoglycan D,D-transpeptidase FtsI family protein n=1 Tax=uncultured Tissierella sp. TaxID=448160 RepID=UPI002803837A|nr:penicillin-binding transpeptidase domain-containing protein [uncultured Tissierella sp.]MDU5080863.1 penicillin-binding transpeptidase domain-containing protein [Bacillota bacterium]
MNKENKRVIFVLVGFCLMFISLIVYISYFQVFRAEAIKNNSYNKRLWINEESILRGSILDRNGRTLAYSEKKGDVYNRYYLYERLYSHIIGYSYREYGKAGLELQYNNTLLNINENAAINEIKNIVAPTTEGNSIKLTIDHDLQTKARSLLKGKKGSIVAMNPTTGEVYAMVSLPDFDVSNLKEDWKEITENPDSPLINRATQGLYAPGSTFKIITTIAALNTVNLDKSYECTGSTNINGYVFKDYQGKAHGNIDLKQALVKSCNTYFTEKAIEIGKDKIGNVAEKFMINNDIPFDLPIKNSQFPFKENLGKTDIAAAAIGQGKLLVTPLNMALIASGIANGGQVVKPILVKEIISKNDKILRKNTTEILSQGTDSIIANEVKDMMVEVIKSGTGTNARIKNVKVAGKTGTAENSSGKSHAWFVGFAPADDPKVAVAVILEEEGSTGGKSAAPIARDIMLHVINNINE